VSHSTAHSDVSRHVALVVPVRGFDDAKSRLSASLSPVQRRTLARNCATGVLRRDVPCLKFVVCDDDEVETWARTCGAIPIRVESRGLNASLHEATPHIVENYPADMLMIVHADLPLPNELDRVIAVLQSALDDDSSSDFKNDFNNNGRVLINPDRHRDGTNVLALSQSLIGKWQFAYGENSFTHHQHEAHRLNCQVDIFESMYLGFDIDTSEDLQHPVIADILPTLLPDWIRT
jgi:2-phospho-L-lactate guanylyltransferase